MYSSGSGRQHHNFNNQNNVNINGNSLFNQMNSFSTSGYNQMSIGNKSYQPNLTSNQQQFNNNSSLLGPGPSGNVNLQQMSPFMNGLVSEPFSPILDQNGLYRLNHPGFEGPSLLGKPTSNKFKKSNPPRPQHNHHHNQSNKSINLNNLTSITPPLSTPTSTETLKPDNLAYQQMLRVREANKRNIELATRSINANKKSCVKTIKQEIIEWDSNSPLAETEAAEELEILMEDEVTRGQATKSGVKLSGVADSQIVAVKGVLACTEDKNSEEKFTVSCYYCKVCAWILNDEQSLKQHLYTVQHRSKMARNSTSLR